MPDEQTIEAATEPRPEGPRPFATISPADGKNLDRVEPTAVETIASLVKEARVAQRGWADEKMADRVNRLGRLKRRILERAEEIADLVHRETGKPIEEAVLAEVLPNADLVDWWCENVEEMLEDEPIDLDPISYPGKRGQIVHAPRGVVALITPWNYPVAIPLRTLVPALLAGNAVVFKPSEIAPRAGALVASLFEGLLPEGVLTLVQGGAEAGLALVSSEIDLVAFTGSVATGKAIARACAERLIPCSLELGGKDAAIVLDDCDLERAVNGVIWGAFTNAGQNCAAVERVYVEAKIARRFIEGLVEAAKALDQTRDTAKMTTQAQRKIALRHLADATDAGAEVLVGGAPEGEGYDFAPTILEIPEGADDRPFLSEETFGPLLPVMVVASADDAIARVNASAFGLTTSVWTRKIRRGREIAARLDSGVVTINNHGFTAAVPAAPWTGHGDSGFGITNSRHALHGLTRPRFILEDRNRARRELWWYPYTPVLRTIAFAMARLKGGAGLFGRIRAFFELLAALPKRLLGG